jgi:hypothetical protein
LPKTRTKATAARWPRAGRPCDRRSKDVFRWPATKGPTAYQDVEAGEEYAKADRAIARRRARAEQDREYHPSSAWHRCASGVVNADVRRTDRRQSECPRPRARLTLSILENSYNSSFGDIVERDTQLHDRQIDQVAGKYSAPSDDDVALLGQHPNGVVQTGRSRQHRQ